jgi:predicted phosphoribosyltransferase
MYVKVYPLKDGRPLRGFCATILEATSETMLGVKISIEVTMMMSQYKKYNVPYDVIVIEPIKKPTKNDLSMCNVPASQDIA